MCPRPANLEGRQYLFRGVMAVIAAEQRPIEEARAHFAIVERHADAVLSRIAAISAVDDGMKIADIGAAQGLFLIACARRGLEAVGIEPWEQARETAMDLASEFNAPIRIVEGVMERIPLPDGSVDIVHANSVVEHVDDVETAFAEVYRILKPGGIFWFSAASSMCPRQGEIRGFPAFGWYPNGVKRRIMDWAKEKRPALIAHTTKPAYNWFTVRKARRMLHETGFKAVYDRWELRLPTEGGPRYRSALAFLKRFPAARVLADIAVPMCSFAAVK